MTLCVGLPMAANAQTFLDRLQKSANGQGKITVHQSAAIDQLVNGTNQKPSVATPKQERATKNAADKEPAKAAPDKSKHETSTPNTSSSATNSSTTTLPSLEETRQKVPRKSYKTSGYRVQVFAGGNTRADRQKAERIGNSLKSNFPNEPIYVHFYSPRWICRMGNYRSYEAAHKMLQAVKELGYSQAIVVRGQVTIMLK